MIVDERAAPGHSSEAENIQVFVYFLSLSF